MLSAVKCFFSSIKYVCAYLCSLRYHSYQKYCISCSSVLGKKSRSRPISYLNILYALFLSSIAWSTRYPYNTHKTVTMKRVIFILDIRLITCRILRGSRWTDVTGTGVACWIIVPPQVVLAGRNPVCGRYFDASEFLKLSFEFLPI